MDDQFSSFLASIYYFKEGTRLQDICKTLYNGYVSQINGYISSLSSGTNILYWVFASKQKKSEAENAYTQLSQMRTQSFVISANKALLEIKDLKNTNIEDIRKEFLSDPNQYLQWVKKVSPTVFSDKGLVSILKKR